MDVMDKPVKVRKGEELDLKKVEGFLKDNIPGLNGGLVFEQFPSGYSNLTYLIKVGNTDLVLRRPPFGRKAKTAHDMGCPFYVMERIHGIILRKDLPRGLDLAPDHMRGLCENLLDVQYQLHSIDYRAVGLEGFGKPEGYVKRQITGWSERFRAAHTPDAPTFEKVMQWLHDKMPPDFNKPAVIHGDYKFDNVVLNPDNPLEIIGVLDWEMATIGDPLMDLGSSLGYWIQDNDPSDFQAARMLPTNLPGALTREEMVQRYADKAGIGIDNFDFYHCFGLFRLAVIAQQIYYRYYHGQTQDERFKMLIFAVHILEEAARRTINKSKL